MNKLLTIVIPTYNMEKYLHRCLDSLLIEKKEELEVLVVNDGSRDSSLAIAKDYEFRYPETFKVIDKKNGNYGSCVNSGLLQATGKYIKILDADDRFESGNLNELIKVMSGLDADLIVTDYLEEFEGGKDKRRICYHFPTGKVFDFLFTPYVKDFEKIAMHSVAYRTEILRTIGYSQSEDISYTDYEWIFSPMSQVKTICYFDKVVYRYLLGREGQTVNPYIYYKRVNDRIIGAKKMISELKLLNMPTKRDHIEYLHSKLFARLYNIYFSCLVVNKDASQLFAFDEFVKEEIPEMYDKLGEAYIYKYLPIRFISRWRNGKESLWRLSYIHDLKMLIKRIFKM